MVAQASSASTWEAVSRRCEFKASLIYMAPQEPDLHSDEALSQITKLKLGMVGVYHLKTGNQNPKVPHCSKLGP